MRNLVLKREEIFAAQRQARDCAPETIQRYNRRALTPHYFPLRSLSRHLSGSSRNGFQSTHNIERRVPLRLPPLRQILLSRGRSSVPNHAHYDGALVVRKMLEPGRLLHDPQSHRSRGPKPAPAPRPPAKHLWTSLPVFHAMHQFHPDGIAVWEFLREPQRRKNGELSPARTIETERLCGLISRTAHSFVQSII